MRSEDTEANIRNDVKIKRGVEAPSMAAFQYITSLCQQSLFAHILFGNLRIASLFFADDVFSLASSTRAQTK